MVWTSVVAMEKVKAVRFKIYFKNRIYRVCPIVICFMCREPWMALRFLDMKSEGMKCPFIKI